GQFVGRAGGGAVDAHLAHRLARPVLAGRPGADLALTERSFEAGMDGEAIGGTLARRFGKRGAAQAPSRSKEGERLEQVRLARAVLAGQYDGAGRKVDGQVAIVAEIRKH